MKRRRWRALGLLIFTALCVVPASRAEAPPPTAEALASYKKPYKFTQDVFTHNIPRWKKILAPYAGKADVRYLEIGLLEGGSFFWMLENILTGAGAQAAGIDPFPRLIHETFLHNLELSGLSEKSMIIKGFSQTEALKLPQESFDIIYIDGSHTAADVMADAVLAFGLLKNGGVLIFDDYEFRLEYPEDLRPRLSIDTFVTAYRNRLEELDKSWQMILRKKEPSHCQPLLYCAPFGQYAYLWEKKQLFLPPERKAPIEISEEERELIEKFTASRKPGQILFEVTPEWRENALFKNLIQRLGVTYESLENLGREVRDEFKA